MNPIKYIFQLSSRQLTILIVILIIEIIGTISLFNVIKRKETAALSTEFISASKELTSSIEKEISLNLEYLFANSALFAVTDSVSREQFNVFNSSVLSRINSIQALEWVPVVKLEDVLRFESRAHNNGFLEFKISESIDSTFKPVSKRSNYFPVFYIEPMLGNEKAFGYDLGSDKTRLTTLKKAIGTNELVATSRITLVQEETSQKGILVFNSVKKNGELLGFVLGVYRIEDLISRALEPMSNKTCNLKVFDLNAKAGNQLLVQINNEERPIVHDNVHISEPEGIYFNQEINIADRKWLVQSTPTKKYLNSFFNTANLSLGICTMLSLALLYFFYRNFKDYNQQEKNKILLETTVNKRTEELQEYAHVVSHDLKSPLRNIEALVSWIKEDNKDTFNENSLQHFDHIDTTLEKMELLITNILGYSSINIESVKIQNVDLNIVVENLKSILFIPDNISIIVLSTLPVIRGEKIKFEQLFQNLISNAIKFNDKEKGIIEIDVKDQNSLYEFSVKDNGIGIERKYQEKIFKIFQVLGSSENSTGIGLAIVKKIVNQFDGGIWVKSVFGKGSTFYFTLKKR